MTILGSIWLSIGLGSILGMFRPYQFIVIFVIQFFYKSIWLLTFALPVALKGNLNPAMQIIISIFILLILEFVLFIRPVDFKIKV